MPTNDPRHYTPLWNDPDEQHWFDDPDEVVAFAAWYFEDAPGARPPEVIALFEKPWKWETEHAEYVTLQERDARTERTRARDRFATTRKEARSGT